MQERKREEQLGKEVRGAETLLSADLAEGTKVGVKKRQVLFKTKEELG